MKRKKKRSHIKCHRQRLSVDKNIANALLINVVFIFDFYFEYNRIFVEFLSFSFCTIKTTKLPNSNELLPSDNVRFEHLPAKIVDQHLPRTAITDIFKRFQSKKEKEIGKFQHFFYRHLVKFSFPLFLLLIREIYSIIYIETYINFITTLEEKNVTKTHEKKKIPAR